MVTRFVSHLPFLRLIAPPLDRLVARLTGGRRTLTGLLTGLPAVTLTTTGARSGELRTVTLLGLRQGEDVVLIASNWGQKHHPAWYHNLRPNPRAMLALEGRDARPYDAREATGAERERYWQRAVDLYPGYARYARTAAPRHIPVLVLSPAEPLPESEELR